MREPGPRPSRGPGRRPGQGPQPRAGNFLRNPAVRPGLGGLARAPGRGRESAKLLSGLGTDLAPRGGRGFLPAPSGLRQPGPLARIQTSRLDPVHAARRGLRAAAEGSATFSSGPGPAPASTWPRDDLARRARGDGCSPDRAGCGRPSSRGREGRLANFAELSPSAGRGRPPARPAARPGPAPSVEGGRRSPSAPSPPAGRRLPRCRGSPCGFAPCGRPGCCLPGGRVALRPGRRWSCRSLPAVAHQSTGVCVDLPGFKRAFRNWEPELKSWV